MRWRVIAVGTRMPRWVDQGFAEYARRLGSQRALALEELPPAPRSAGRAAAAAVRTEGERLLAKLRPGDFVTPLDERGRELSTRELADWVATRQREGRDVAFVIGGPDGLAEAVRARGDFTWSLSRLTLPHALVRVLLVEQLYRAHTVLARHPYHRD
ncbi:MAG: 23S rRNA (pseudouridine(1915)-N(3))-methyltransferase RlmH [Steroidobacteraceae bacterium]